MLNLNLNKKRLKKISEFRKQLKPKKYFKKVKWQRKIFRLVSRIPRGKVSTYQEIARKLKKENGARLVGMILSQNRNLIKIPCHRVIMKNGKVGGYVLGYKEKMKILANEGIRVDFKKRRVINFKDYLFSFSNSESKAKIKNVKNQ